MFANQTFNQIYGDVIEIYVNNRFLYYQKTIHFIKIFYLLVNFKAFNLIYQSYIF